MTVAAATDLLPIALAPFAQDWADPAVEDIFVVGPGHYFVRRAGVTTQREAPDLDPLAVEAIAVLAAHLRGQPADEAHPILDCELPSGERLNAVLFPCTPVSRPSLAIRRAAEHVMTLDSLEQQGLFSDLAARIAAGGLPETARRRAYAQELRAAGKIKALLRHAVACRWTTIFSGATGSGKTANATAMALEIPLEDRIVTVANAEEMRSLPHRNRVSFLHSKDGPVSAEALIDAALRNAPRWLIVQEVRGAEAFSFIRACASGHPGITTIHAPSALATFDALSINIRQHPAGARLPEDTLRAMLHGFVDLVVHVERRADGSFGVTDIVFGWEVR